jgi:hypothetical protein
MDHIRYVANGSTLDSAITLFNNRNFLGVNEGPPSQVLRGEGILQFWPFATIASGDSFYINYWKKGSAYINAVTVDAVNALTFIPDLLYNPVMAEIAARANMFLDSKQAGTLQTLADKYYSRSLGATDLGSCNG